MSAQILSHRHHQTLVLTISNPEHRNALGPELYAAGVEALLRTPQQDFPVVDGAGRLSGLLTRDAIIHALRQSGPATPVTDAMAEIPRVPRAMPLPEALKALSGAPAVAVQEASGAFVGLLTPANLADLIALKG